MAVGGLVDTVFRFNRLCECHLYTAPRNRLLIQAIQALTTLAQHACFCFFVAVPDAKGF
jgi:hypothetical protein